MKFLHERADFADLINVAGTASDIPEAFIIKDYWVTEILRTIQGSELNGRVIFKGGTSLSKAYGIINRFSEDIDLLFTDSKSGKNQRRKQMKLAEACALKLPGLLLDKDNRDNFSSDDHKTTCLEYPSENTAVQTDSDLIALHERNMRIGQERIASLCLSAKAQGYFSSQNQETLLLRASSIQMQILGFLVLVSAKETEIAIDLKKELFRCCFQALTQ